MTDKNINMVQGILPGPHNVTGVLYYATDKIPEMTCQDFVDLTNKYFSGRN